MKPKRSISKTNYEIYRHHRSVVGSSRRSRLFRPALYKTVLIGLVTLFSCLLLAPNALASQDSSQSVPRSSTPHSSHLSHARAGSTPSTSPTSVASPSPQVASTISSIQSSDEPIVLQIARLTDQLQKVEEQLAVDQVKKALDNLELSQAQSVMRQDAVDAFISGGESQPNLSLLAPSPVPHYYTDVVLRRQHDIVETLHRDEAKANSDTQTQLADYQALGTLNAALTKERQALESTVNPDPSLSLTEQEIRAQALAYQQSQSELNQQNFGGGNYSGQSALSATEAQQQLQSKYPFGPLLPSQLGASGLQETGQTISGVASWYGPGFDGLRTASGAIYDENGWTCASPNLPFGTMLLVTSGSYGVLVEVNDRGPYAAGRVLDLSHAAAEAIHSTGLANVVAYVVVPT